MPLRTKNPAEQHVVDDLESQGYTVLKNGWPDFLAFKGTEVRLIEVKPHGRRHLSPRQKRMANALALTGLKVELVAPPDGVNWKVVGEG
jgi:hypothetical protein